MLRFALRTRLLVGAALAVLVSTLLVQSAGAVSANLVVSQVYGGGGNTGATYTHDYIEIFNRGTGTVSLDGMSLQYASATGTANFGANAAMLTELSGSLAPGQYLLVQESSNAAVGAPLPTPDLVDATPILMAAGAGKVALVTGQTTLGCNGGSAQPCDAAALARIVDLVGLRQRELLRGPRRGPDDLGHAGRVPGRRRLRGQGQQLRGLRDCNAESAQHGFAARRLLERRRAGDLRRSHPRTVRPV